MLRIALATLRTRWTGFVGSFVALALGAGLLAVMGLALASSLHAPERKPERFAAAPVLVKGADTLRVATPAGDRVRKLSRPRAVPDEVKARLSRLGRVVEDRAFGVRVRGGPPDLVGHPWPTAAFTPYHLTEGRAPRAGDEVAVSDGWSADGGPVRPGERLRTARGTVRVVGVVGGRGFENAVFYTGRRAAQLSPESPQLVVDTDDAAAVRAVVRDGGAGAHVLTGDARRLADADPDRDREALTAMNAMFGTAGGVSAFVSVFVVAATFAFAVAQRRREFGLLRMAGATPAQVRRTVLCEALVVGALASATGCLLGAQGAPELAAWAVDRELAPRWFRIGDHIWPYHLAFWTGLLVALAGAVAASWRAGRTAPAEALRESAADSRALPLLRRLCAGALLLTAAVALVVSLATDPSDLLHRKTYVTRPMLLIVGVALLAPLLVGPLVRLLAWLPARLPGAAGMLLRQNAVTGRSRTAAVAAPVLITVALTGSLLGATATLSGAEATELRTGTAADLVLTPTRPQGFEEATLRRLRQLPGTEVSASSTSAVYTLEDGVALVESPARAADPVRLRATARPPLVAGSLADLDDDSIVVNEEWEQHTVGRRVEVWLGDGTRKSLRIAAVMAVGTGGNGVYVTPRNAPRAPVDRVDVRLREGADAAAVSAALREAVPASDGRVRTKEEWIRERRPDAARTTRAGLFLVLGIALLYTAIALADIMAMSTADRVRELALLRLAGATRRQVLRTVAAEALLVVGVGGLLGTAVAGLQLAGMWCALSLLSVWTPLQLPWAALGGVLAACALIAVLCATVPAALSLRHRAVGLAGVRE
ncbi:ABC transporter permease [Streptomyces qinglanensis]|uniref:ABC transporter permease n=1 Tax=Streptomyces qinglanensis TaxID=943816 RepID=A0A1E7K588_9ACTN|nr:FtsX-like permease family protein [Streptomyces qinglanensis]OEU99098.1 ABC transporter permease [Streptomyces qinglanensis]